MGLDMYLYKVKREEVIYWRKANAIHAWFCKKYEERSGEELGNCQDIHVPKEDLEELKSICKRILDSSKLVYTEVPVKSYDYDKREYVTKMQLVKALEDPSLAQELLPTQSGFFFGSTLYDEWYVEDLKDTIEKIDETLKTVDFDEYDLMYSAWW